MSTSGEQTWPVRIRTARWLDGAVLPPSIRWRYPLMLLASLLAMLLIAALLVAAVAMHESPGALLLVIALAVTVATGYWVWRTRRAMRRAGRPEADGSCPAYPRELIHVHADRVEIYPANRCPPIVLPAVGTAPEEGPQADDSSTLWPDPLRLSLTDLRHLAGTIGDVDGACTRTEALHFTRSGKRPVIINGYLLEEDVEVIVERIERAWRRPHERVSGRTPAAVKPDGSPHGSAAGSPDPRMAE